MKTTKIIFSAFLFTLFSIGQIDAQSWYGSGVKGQGAKVKKTFDLPNFDAVQLTIDGDVYLRQGDSQSVEIEAQENILELISTEVEGNAWKIKFDKNVRTHDGVKIWITIPHLTMVAVSGSGDIEGQNYFKGLGDLRVAVSGSGGIDLESDSQSLDAAVSGSGDIELGGTTGDCDIRISGSGDVTAFDLETETCGVKIAGSGDASVNVRNELEVKIAGSGDVVYKGNPRVKSKISGSGDVTSK